MQIRKILWQSYETFATSLHTTCAVIFIAHGSCYNSLNVFLAKWTDFWGRRNNQWEITSALHHTDASFNEISIQIGMKIIYYGICKNGCLVSLALRLDTLNRLIYFTFFVFVVVAISVIISISCSHTHIFYLIFGYSSNTMFIYDSCNNDETIWKSRNYVTSKCSHCWYAQGVKNKKKKHSSLPST